MNSLDKNESVDKQFYKRYMLSINGKIGIPFLFFEKNNRYNICRV